MFLPGTDFRHLPFQRRRMWKERSARHASGVWLRLKKGRWKVLRPSVDPRADCRLRLPPSSRVRRRHLIIPSVCTMCTVD
ncbi:hypothetical protein BAUCODRAFT_228966 [Baudoinia panamericana UAMH 10762]|uniref:Uncharacterized protein n=1 Tax=Baudoinia panamericana (strain UAMH 10762) TaxID=717646 RepID=M2N358_BAUPA|nr:uncharacterized protein BAUCODRAFT_228966 [Baudoinia panamericana UAMH 10762]EMC93125.1 hypothetical protein BAUCODRAFT_228966 [Baudoinia panamericana UAMH 10762]